MHLSPTSKLGYLSFNKVHYITRCYKNVNITCLILKRNVLLIKRGHSKVDVAVHYVDIALVNA